jgi:hypothetical protein
MGRVADVIGQKRKEIDESEEGGPKFDNETKNLIISISLKFYLKEGGE